MATVKYDKKEYSVRDFGCKKLITECFVPFSGNGQYICRSFEMGQCPKKTKASVSEKELKRRLKKSIEELEQKEDKMKTVFRATSVKGISWMKQEDGQLTKTIIHFLPAKKEKP